MRRLSVLGVTRAAFAFTFEQLGAIIAVIWLPMSVLTVGSFFVDQRLYAAFETAYVSHGVIDGAALLLFPAYIVLAMLFYAVMMVGVAQLVLGTRAAGRLPLSLGLPEWRLFRAWFGLALFLMMPLLIFLFGASAMVGDPAAMSQTQVGRLGIMALLLLAGIVFVGLRFSFLMPGLAATDAGAERGLLTRAWLLSSGNFWRIFAILAACLVPVYFCVGLMETVAELATATAPQSTPSDIAGAIARMRETLPLAKGFQFLTAPFVIGLMASASVYAGRELNRTDISV